MTFRQKLLLGGAGVIVISAVVTGTMRMFSGHGDPITVDNPGIRVGFGFTGHRMKIERDVQGLAQKFTRDITGLKQLNVLARNGTSHEVVAKSGEPITFSIYNREFTISVRTEPGTEYEQLAVYVNGLFGKCLFDSFFLNGCSASDSDIRLHSIRYVDNDNRKRHYCLNAWEELTEGRAICEPPDSTRKASVEFLMLAEKGLRLKQ